MFKNKIIVIFTILILITLFISPWLWIDNGENVFESKNYRNKISQGELKILEEDGKKACNCDGSCAYIKWVPFGAVIKNCKKSYFYITPLGNIIKK